MKELLKGLSLKKYEYNIFIIYEVIRTNVKRLTKSGNLNFKGSFTCNSSLVNKDINLIFFLFERSGLVD